MLLTFLFFYLPLYLIKVAVLWTFQYLFGSVIFDCYSMLFCWLFFSLFLVAMVGSAPCRRVFLGVLKLGCCLLAAFFSSAGGVPGSCSAKDVTEPLSLASCIKLAVAAKAKAACATPAATLPSRPVVKAQPCPKLQPPAFFVKSLVSPFSVSAANRRMSSARRAARLLLANGSVRLAIANGSLVSFDRGLSLPGQSLSGFFGPALDGYPVAASVVGGCRYVGGVRRRRSAAAWPLRARGDGGRIPSDIVGMSAAISLWSSFGSAAATACQLLLVSSCGMKANAGLCLASCPAPPASTTAHLERSAFGGVPHLTVSGRVKKPVVTGAAARKMRRAGVADALRLKQKRLALTGTVASTAAPTSVWPFLAATAAAAVGSVRGCVPRLPRLARVKKPVAKSATQRRMCRAGAKEALSLHQSRLAAAGAIARAASAARQNEKAARPIRAISRRRALASAATGSAFCAFVAPSALGVSASLLSASAPFTGGISRGVSLAGVASPALSPKKSSSGSSSSRRGIPPLNTTK
ncbi:hypothetical protein V8B55DRAFT_1567710 [Mucor lusitanicus]|uniref:Uncharacterized protein n=1 Tax=Mucor circinelloides f. lusitanicus TaxID=29924 RepID=A0A8H4BDI2_MUCCL|nr:hypothetical protein FB192DRAFT_1449749 [Mucor lusitanicus]